MYFCSLNKKLSKSVFVLKGGHCVFRMATVKGYRHNLLFPAVLIWLLVMNPAILSKNHLDVPMPKMA